MNVDKFGHYIHKRMRLSELFDCYDNVLTKSDSGEFDLKASRLRGIRSPIEADDAANKDYVDHSQDNMKKEINKLIGQLQHYVQLDIKAKISDVLSHLEDKFYTKSEIDKFLKKPSQ